MVRSATKVSLLIVFPKAIGKSISACWNLGEVMTVRINTSLPFWLGTSIPMVPLPGIGAMIRIPLAANLSAMSSSKLLILEMRIPATGTIS